MSRRTIARIDDWLNPIVVKELRQAVQSKLVVAGLMLFLFFQVLILAWVLLDAGTAAQTSSSNQLGGLNTRVGRRVSEVLQYLMLGTCLLVPLYVGGRLAAERSDTHTDLLFISALKPRSIVSGKFLSGLVLVLLIFSACAPFLAFTYLLRGIDVPSVLFLLGLDLILALGGIATTIFLGVIPAPRAIKGLMGVGAVFALGGLFSWGMALSLRQINGGLFANAREFWTRGALTAGVLAGGVGLLFTWSIAVLSPPAANKGVFLRGYILAVVVLLGAAALYLGWKETHFRYLQPWLIASAGLCCVQLFISINEREHLGPRIVRTIPRSPLLRPLAFLFYSGAAGGVVFCVLLLSACVALALTLTTWVNPPTELGTTRAGLGWYGEIDLLFGARFGVLAGLYTLCFCLTGIFLRAWVLREQVRQNLTWMVVVLLVGVGSMGPYVVAYFAAPELLLPEQTDRTWLWTNPFYTIDISLRRELLGRSLDDQDWRWVFTAECMPFLTVWLAGAALVSLPWLLRQTRVFIRPLSAPMPALAPTHLAPALTTPLLADGIVKRP